MTTLIDYKERPLEHSQKVMIIVSRFNTDVTQKLLTGTHQRLLQLGIIGQDIDVIWVPGAIEIPLVVKLVAEQNKHAVIICLGAVIRGETTHYDYVCSQVSNGCARVGLETRKPIIFGILTIENEAQAYDRLGGAHGHKGHDFAEAAVEMIQVCHALQSC